MGLRQGNAKRVTHSARLPQSAQRLKSQRPLSELLQVDIALENWSLEEREEFEEKFSRKYRRSFFDFSSGAAKGWQFYCPLCGCTRRVSHSPSPYRAIHFARVGVTAALMMVLFWPLLAWKGVLVFLPLWMVFEIVFRIRMRAELACDQCGFDPTLYLSDIGRARQEVDEFWKRKLGQPASEELVRQVPQRRSPQRSQDLDEASGMNPDEGALRREEVAGDVETLLDRR